MKRAFIIHGYGATPEDHWFSWLGQQLQAAGVATAIPALPAPEQPDFYHWQAALAAHIGRPASVRYANTPNGFVANLFRYIAMLYET
jgi:esterase